MTTPAQIWQASADGWEASAKANRELAVTLFKQGQEQLAIAAAQSAIRCEKWALEDKLKAQGIYSYEQNTN